MSEVSARPRILFATDLSRWTAGAEWYACALASSLERYADRHQRLESSHRGWIPSMPSIVVYLGELLKQATRDLIDLKSRTVKRGISVHTRIATGIPSQEILAAAQAEDTDLIVLGTKREDRP